MDRNTILKKLEEYEEQITREIYDTEYDLCCSSMRYEIFLGFDDEGNYEIFTVPVGNWGYDTDYSVYLGTVGFGEEIDLWSYETFVYLGYIDDWDVIEEIAGSDITETEDGWLYKDEEYYDFYDMADAVIEDNQEYWKDFINEYRDYKCYLYCEWWGQVIEHIDEDWEKGMFVQECKENGKFNDFQMDEIREGFFEGYLSMEQVKVYAKPEFDDEQMRRIREGFQSGLTMEQVKIYAKPEIDDEQMEQIRSLLKTEDTEFVKSLVENKNNFDFYMALAN